MSCSVCRTLTAEVFRYHRWPVTDVPVDGHPVVVRLRVRRPVCPVLGCRRQTFREQIPGLLERHQHRTVRLACQVSQVARELCGREGRTPSPASWPSPSPAAPHCAICEACRSRNRRSHG